MKLVTQEVYTRFVQELTSGEGLEVDGAVESVVQTIDIDGIVRAQTIFFKGDADPQYMIDKRAAWSAILRASQIQVTERNAVADALLPRLPGVQIDG